MNNIKSNIIVIFGGMGTGKSTLTELIAEELEKFSFDVYTHNIGDTCRFISKISRVNLIWENNERTLQQQVATKLREIDENILNDIIYTDITSIGEVCNKGTKRIHIVTGGRTLEDFKYWDSKNSFSVGIVSDKNTTSQRLSTRDLGQKQDETHLLHETEKNTEHISRNLCDALVVNHGTLSDLKEEAIKITTTYMNLISNLN